MLPYRGCKKSKFAHKRFRESLVFGSECLLEAEFDLYHHPVSPSTVRFQPRGGAPGKISQLATTIPTSRTCPCLSRRHQRLIPRTPITKCRRSTSPFSNCSSTRPAFPSTSTSRTNMHFCRAPQEFRAASISRVRFLASSRSRRGAPRFVRSRTSNFESTIELFRNSPSRRSAGQDFTIHFICTLPSSGPEGLGTPALGLLSVANFMCPARCPDVPLPFFLRAAAARMEGFSSTHDLAENQVDRLFDGFVKRRPESDQLREPRIYGILAAGFGP